MSVFPTTNFLVAFSQIVFFRRQQQDWMAKTDDSTPKYTRIDFLRFDTDSIKSEGNQTLYENLQKLNQKGKTGDGVETWEDWANYPLLDEIDDSSDEAIDMIAWLIHNFSPIVCFDDEHRENYRTKIKEKKLDWISPDDFAFLFCQCQNSINKWHRLHKVQDTEEFKALSRGQQLKVEGSEHKIGSGASGTEGQQRHNQMLKYFKNNYSSNNNNRKALLSRLEKLVAAEESHLNDLDESEGPPTKKSKKSNPEPIAVDKELNDYYSSQWDSSFNFDCGQTMVL